MIHQFVRVGVFGHVGRFRSAQAAPYQHGRRVVCRTRRGLEIGMALGSQAAADASEFDRLPTAETDNAQTVEGRPDDGVVLRYVTAEDDLVLARLERNRLAALADCEQLLASRKSDATLVEVEHLFDGQSLFFYFLGEVDAHTAQLTEQLAATYESRVQFRQFSDAMERGCGPDCGTEAAAGCGDGCSHCALAEACAKPPVATGAKEAGSAD